MILSRPDILDYLKNGRLAFDPPIEEGQVAQVSIDLHLGCEFTIFKVPPKYLPAIKIDSSLWESEDLWQHYTQDEFQLNPNEFVLAQTLEKVTIPPELVGLVEGRIIVVLTTLSRRVTSSQTALQIRRAVRPSNPDTFPRVHEPSSRTGDTVGPYPNTFCVR